MTWAGKTNYQHINVISIRLGRIWLLLLWQQKHVYSKTIIIIMCTTSSDWLFPWQGLNNDDRRCVSVCARHVFMQLQVDTHTHTHTHTQMHAKLYKFQQSCSSQPRLIFHTHPHIFSFWKGELHDDFQQGRFECNKSFYNESESLRLFALNAKASFPDIDSETCSDGLLTIKCISIFTDIKLL